MPEPPELPPIAQAPLSIVLPAHNDGATVADVVRGWLTCLDCLQRDYELLVVDDGSTDATAARVEEWAGKFPRLRLLRHAAARGFGAALRTGLAEARHPLFGYSTCDGHYRPDDLRLLLGAIDKVHLVSGYRVVQQAPRPLLVRPGWPYRAFVRLIFGVRLRDVDCAFKLFRREIFGRIPIQSVGRFVQVEIVAKANFLGCVMDEVAVTYRGPLTVPGSLRAVWADAHRVRHHPDFGPAVLPGTVVPPAALPAEQAPVPPS